MKTATTDRSHASELNPPENITPSIGTTINAILILAPLSLILIGLFSGLINP
ncbi:purine permease [Chamaesiphon sp. OTE_8_metabat_110]|uniref:purine permease n=1 Tax=Chamaesiphon sp. OTE_8_metabat_110 TaxID=2964696 RepID=UPI00286C2B43|nr:purine permease [Chamaesiphon sp. OTE_8_metabat_110]